MDIRLTHQRRADLGVQAGALVRPVPVGEEDIPADDTDVHVALAGDVGPVGVGALGKDDNVVSGELRVRGDRVTNGLLSPLQLLGFSR